MNPRYAFATSSGMASNYLARVWSGWPWRPILLAHTGFTQ